MYNFAELMLPDGAHKRDEDTTVFLHYRRLSASIDCFATGVHARDAIDEMQEMLYL